VRIYLFIFIYFIQQVFIELIKSDIRHLYCYNSHLRWILFF